MGHHYIDNAGQVVYLSCLAGALCVVSGVVSHQCESIHGSSYNVIG